MSYIKYKTKGFVIGGVNVGEATRIYNIFTQQFGLIRVRAQGVRELNSKLKFHLQNLFLIEAYLVKGKNGWRITEAYKIKSLSDIFKDNKLKLQTSTRLLVFLKRMLPEEDKNEELFDIIITGLAQMEEGADKDILNLETLIILRLLRTLGYIKGSKSLNTLILNNLINQQILSYVKEYRPMIIKEINQSISASEL